MVNEYDVIVIGGGAAGMFAAVQAGYAGAKVLLLEPNDRLGKKLLITGKGRCNLTNNCSWQEVMKNVPRNSRFLYSALSGFTPEDAITFFESHGCETKTERGNRVFPVSDKSASVLEALKTALGYAGVEIVRARAKELLTVGAVIGRPQNAEAPQAFPLSGRCPSSQTGADEVVPRQAIATDEALRAASPTASVSGLAGDARCHLPLQGKAKDGECTTSLPPGGKVPPQGADEGVTRQGAVFDEALRATDSTSSVTASPCHLPIQGKAEENAAAHITGVRTDRGDFYAPAVILATGGKSYPATGSTGDGYRLARALGHSIVPPVGSLVPLVEDGGFCAQMQGLALKNVNVRLFCHSERSEESASPVPQSLPPGGKVPPQGADEGVTRQGAVFDEALRAADSTSSVSGLAGDARCHLPLKGKAAGKPVFEEFGELLFTHFGLSGPVILSASAHMEPGKRYIIEIDLKPALDEEKLDARILRDFAESKNRSFENALSGLYPKTMIPVIVARSGIPGETKVNSVTREQRRALLELTKHFSVKISGLRPVEEAIITSGGVSTKEIDPKTMESKLVGGLYFAGEVIDVDAYGVRGGKRSGETGDRGQVTIEN